MTFKKIGILMAATLFASLTQFNVLGSMGENLVPSQTFSYDNTFSGASDPVWDITGHYTGNVNEALSLDMTLSEASSGKISGNGIVSVNGKDSKDQDWNVIGTGPVTGMVKASGTTGLVTLTLMVTSGSGTAVVSGTTPENVSFTGTIKLTGHLANGQLDITGGSALAKLKGAVSHKALTQSTKEIAGTFTLPGDVTGDWNLSFDLAQKSPKLSGTAYVLTSASTSLSMTAIGSISSVTHSSKLTLKGSGNSLSLTLSGSGSSVTVESMKGKLFGQPVNYIAP